VHDGTLSMHLDNASVNIPSQLLEKSPIFVNALSVPQSSVTRTVSLPAPTKWLEAWVLCYCDEEEKDLSSQDIEVLVNCLLVLFLLAPGSHRS
jgi:hypothetical protein